MEFQVRLDGNAFGRDMRTFLDTGIRGILDVGTSILAGNRRGGEMALALLILDEEVDEYVRRCGEAAEPIWSDYYYLKAAACALAGQKDRGHGYARRARERRTGGRDYDFCKRFYPDI